MTRIRKIVLIVVGGIIVLAMLAVVIAKVVLTKERILAALTPRIEAAINRPVTINEAGISFGAGISVWLGDITIGNHPGFSSEPLLTLHRFDLTARFWPLLVGRVELDHVLLDSPSLLVEYNANGATNLENLLSENDGDSVASAPDAAGETPPLSVEIIRVRDGNLIRRDLESGDTDYLAGLVVDLNWHKVSSMPTGSFRAEVMFDSLTITRDTALWSIGEGSPQVYLAGRWDTESDRAEFDSVTVAWWGAVVAAQGVVRRLPSLTEIQVHARLQQTDLADLAGRLSDEMKLDVLQDLQGSANGEIDASLVWPLPEGAVPEWQATLTFEGIRWAIPDVADPLTLARLEVRGDGQTVSWSAPAGRFGGGNVSLSGTIDRLFSESAMLSARIRADFPVEVIQQFLPEKPTWTASGELTCDLTAYGPLDTWRHARVAGTLASPGLVVHDTGWSVDSVATSFSARSDGQDLEILTCRWTAGESMGQVQGTVSGLIKLARSGFESDDVARGTLNFRCSRLNLDQIIGDEEEGTATAADESDPSRTLSAFVLTGKLQADTVIYSQLPIADLQSEYEFKNRKLTLDPVAGRVFGGPLNASLTWDVADWVSPTFSAHIRADSMESNQFLTRYFDWAGGILGKFEFNGRFTGQGRTAIDILPSLAASGRADMRTGKAEVVPLLSTVGKKLGVSGLDKPRGLRDVAVPFRIDQGRVITDKLEFKSGEFSFTASGSFGLDRSLNYQVTAITDRGVKIPFALKGSVASPVLSLDAKGTAESLIQRIAPKVTDSLMQKTVKDTTARNLLNKALRGITEPGNP